MENRHRVLRCIIYIIEIILFFIVQETPFLVPQLYNVKPLIILLVAISIAIFETTAFSMFFSVATGLMMDMGYGGTIGLNIIAVSVACYIINYIFTSVVRTNIFTAMIAFAAAIFFVLSLDCLFYFLIRDIDQKLLIYFTYYCTIMLYTFLLFPIFYYINKLIHQLSKKKEKVLP